ncbi:MAG: methyltransferase domain-containing protein [Bryobacterales bacterium]|nr:methyltransferase domain-containing protein [Bryobacteraceae bacterium]MDW8130987.1 methyltransferase domain-containing protein [Bryobacterales bacterium]
MVQRRSWLAAWLALAACAFPVRGQTPEEIWREFVEWGQKRPRENPARKSMMDLYVEDLVGRGASEEEARRRWKVIAYEMRPRSRENNQFFWDTLFRLRSGPDHPLKLLVEVVKDLKPGRALDVAMGNGRNAAFLASAGWQVVGYDISPEAVALARQRAESLGVRYEAVECDHRQFDYGRERWDLIVFSYIVADEPDMQEVFGERLWNSLRPGGRMVCEGNFCEKLIRRLVPLDLPGFRLERYSDAEELREDWGSGATKGRVIRAIVRKDP